MLTHPTTHSSTQPTTTWEYLTFQETLWHPDCGNYISFGIGVYQLYTQQRTFVSAIHDISLKEELVKNLTSLFNQLQLSPIHFPEVISDILSQSALEI